MERSAEEKFASSKAAMTGVPGVGGQATMDQSVLHGLGLDSGFEKGTAVFLRWKPIG